MKKLLLLLIIGAGAAYGQGQVQVTVTDLDNVSVNGRPAVSILDAATQAKTAQERAAIRVAVLAYERALSQRVNDAEGTCAALIAKLTAPNATLPDVQAEAAKTGRQRQIDELQKQKADAQTRAADIQAQIDALNQQAAPKP